MRFPILSASISPIDMARREDGMELTLPHMYVPENKARANQRKMNDVIDNPTR
jgi:hypothetical protein